MTRSRTKLWIASCSVAAVLLIAAVDLGRTAPGPLTAVHQREPDLDGRRDCSECHGGWGESMTEACLDCHEAIADDIRTASGLHGVIGRKQALACSRCHSEHHGVGFAIVNRQSFARAGVPDPGAFDHALVGQRLDGAHLELECRKCHANADAAVLPRGELRYRGLEQGCGTCHEDGHEGRMELACVSCHGQQEWKELSAAGHDEVLPLVGGHADLECRSCHAEAEPHALEVLGGRGRKPSPRDCIACHESPHAEGFVAGVARQESLASGASCVVCHAAEHESFRDESLELGPERHATSGFALVAPHAQAACVDCHLPVDAEFAVRYPGREPDQCASCHEDPHGGQFSTGPFAAAGCVGCHERERFEPHAFTTVEHDSAALPLDGRHMELECTACHEVLSEGEPRVFRGTPSDCEGCHPDAHDGFFVDHAPELAQDEHGACAACHMTTRFDELAPGGFDHAAQTGFPVEGAHAQAACEVCHERAEQPDERGRRFGRVHELFGPFEGCVTCHPDPHEGLFDPPHHALEVEGRRDCARCHATSSFRAFPDGFDHQRWTGFGLVGRHAEAACSACHAPQSAAQRDGRTWGRALGTACADCHVDVHAGQFSERDRTDCARCHASSSSFELLSFDHERDARFALGEPHGALACSACHAQEPDGRGGELVRYRPLPTGCADCHGLHDQPLLRRRRGGR